MQQRLLRALRAGETQVASEIAGVLNNTASADWKEVIGIDKSPSIPPFLKNVHVVIKASEIGFIFSDNGEIWYDNKMLQSPEFIWASGNNLLFLKNCLTRYQHGVLKVKATFGTEVDKTDGVGKETLFAKSFQGLTVTDKDLSSKEVVEIREDVFAYFEHLEIFNATAEPVRN